MALFDNLVVQEIWDAILPAKYPTKSKLLTSGIVYNDTATKFSGGGIYQHTPFVTEPTATMQKPASSTTLTGYGLAMSQDIMVCVNRQQDFYISKKEMRRLGIVTANDQTSAGAIDTLMGLTSNYIGKQIDKYLYYVLKGAFAAGGALEATHIQSETGATIGLEGLFRAKAKLSESASQLQYTVMHSKVMNDARLAGLVDYKLAGSFGENLLTSGELARIGGLNVLESDLVNYTSDIPPIYSTYLFAPNSLYFANPYLSVEPYYIPNVGGGEFHVVISMDFVCHIPGVKYALTNQDPTDAQLYAAATWSKIADHNQDVKVVELLTQ